MQSEGKKKKGHVVPLQQNPKGTPCRNGGVGIHQVSGGVHLDVGVLQLPHQVSTHGIYQLVHGGGCGRRCKKTTRGKPEAEFPPQNCGSSFPLKTRVPRGAAQVNVNYLGGAVQGCCVGHYILHCKGPRLVGRPLHLVVGDRHGLALRQGVGSSIRARTTRREARRESAGTWSNKVLKKSVREGNSGKGVNSCEIHTDFVTIHTI